MKLRGSRKNKTVGIININSYVLVFPSSSITVTLSILLVPRCGRRFCLYIVKIFFVNFFALWFYLTTVATLVNLKKQGAVAVR